MSSFSADLPPHLVALVPAQWAAWRWFVLRGAGFPAAMAGRLAQPLCAAAADNVIQAEIEAENQIQTAVRALNEALDRFTAEGVQRHDQRFIALLNARRRLTSGKIPESYDPAGGLAETVGAIKLALARRDHLRLEFERLFLAGIEQQSAVLQSFASDPRFREAILWQNQHAFQNAIQPVARTQCGDTRNQRQRNHEELVASYAQRYCVKNDTIGFFGPVSWGRVEDDGDVIEISLGASLIKSRQTYFESWAVDKIAASLSLLEGMAWWIPPRLLPDVYLENGLLHRAGVPPVGVTGLEFAALRLCDGKALPEDILRAVQDDARFKAIGQSSLRQLLKAHTSKGNLVWRFLVPVEVNCEVSLRKQLNRIGDAELRERATRQLDQLEGARADVANAAGDPEQLNHALSKAEQTFAAITNTPGLRNAGATYGGRTILYEDCQRDIALRITPELLSPVFPALSLLLQSLRWLMQSMALEFHRLFLQTLSEISGAGGCPEIRLLAWWLYTEPKLLNASSLADVDQFRKKWAETLPVNPDKTAIYLKSGDLKEKIDSLFPEHGPGFYPVRYFCPDLMLAGASVED
ncbi:MAG TPA: lantibiotic dehydratase, partial [Candidatus Angelobacter sp.]|nr:lantibiotic dehydratase [Candidatus Angelobacter sp.]